MVVDDARCALGDLHWRSYAPRHDSATNNAIIAQLEICGKAGVDSATGLVEFSTIHWQSQLDLASSVAEHANEALS